MAGLITKDQREQRIVGVLGFIFLFRFVTVKDLNLLGSTVLGVNDMRRTIEYLLKYKFINKFDVSTPMRTTAFYLLDAGLKKIPRGLLQYEYSFYPVWYKPGKFWHDSGVSEVCLWFQKMTTQGYWVSEWMIRQGRAKGVAKKAVGQPGKKTMYRRRLPDGFFVVNKGVRIAIEFENTRKNIHDWADMIRDLEHGLKDREKVDPATNAIVLGRDFGAVLFVFSEKKTLEVYRNRFDEYANNGRKHELVVLNPERFFLTTLENLKEGKVYRGPREISFTGFLEIVEALHKNVEKIESIV